MDNTVVTVALFSGMEAFLSYLVPPHLAGQVRRGHLVEVPLRGGSAVGIVMDVTDNAPPQKFRLKPIYSLIQPQRVLTDDLLKLSAWMQKYYCAGLQSVFESMIPSVVRGGKNPLSAKEIVLANPLSEEDFVKLSRRAPVQANVYEHLLNAKAPMLRAALLRVSNASDAAIAALVKKGVFKERVKILERIAYEDNLSAAERVSSDEHILNAQQQKALDEILANIRDEKFHAHLLFGITGSGKTEVYMRAMKSVVEEGGSCIFLVPEISLTPQTVGRLRSRLGNLGTELVVWHSGLSDGQRLDAWRALAEGRARIVVGARSCIFAPLENPKLIIIDEEHDGAYKQDKNPRYNARDVAVMRANLGGGTCVLGSATPSLETLHNVRQKKYSESRISERVDDCELPKMLLVNMQFEKPGAILSNMLVDKLMARMDKGEQSILFLNRRGYSKVFECDDCGEVAKCPHCAVSMTWHKNEGLVKCHLCGFQMRPPTRCGQCDSPRVNWRSHGTQKIEEIVQKILPSARIGRMDADTMKHKDDYRRTLADFRHGNLDILIGTQMIAKGLDFPRVTLVGILNADISLHMPDFRSAERTYQLIVQVAGRAGRGVSRGEVIIQTKNPDAAPIQHAKTADMDAFLEEELATRIEYGYPPAQKLIRHLFRSRSLQKLEYYTEEWAKLAEKHLGEVCQIRGPAPAPIERIEEFYRYQIWYFCSSVTKITGILNKLRREFPMDPDIREIIDVDPYDLS